MALAESQRSAKSQRSSTLDAELSGLDALEMAGDPRAARWRRAWASAWPKLAALGLAIGLWELVVRMEWRDEFLLPSPFTVFAHMRDEFFSTEFGDAVLTTLRRALTGFGIALVIGSLLGAAVARVRPLRAAFGSLITGLQTMPSIAWFPLAILLLKLSEGAILFVVVLGAAPSIANGLLYGVDHVPPLYLRAGRVLGARGLATWRYVIIPATLPSFVAGLKQGWALAWRSLMAGELLVLIAGTSSIGVELQEARNFSDAPALLSWMIVILVIGIVVNTVFASAEKSIRRRWGLLAS